MKKYLDDIIDLKKFNILVPVNKVKTVCKIKDSFE